MMDEKSRSASIALRSSLPSPTMCSCPMYSASVRGRIRAASGASLFMRSSSAWSNKSVINRFYHSPSCDPIGCSRLKRRRSLNSERGDGRLEIREDINEHAEAAIVQGNHGCLGWIQQLQVGRFVSSRRLIPFRISSSPTSGEKSRSRLNIAFKARKPALLTKGACSRSTSI